MTKQEMDVSVCTKAVSSIPPPVGLDREAEGGGWGAGADLEPMRYRGPHPIMRTLGEQMVRIRCPRKLAIHAWA